MIANISPAGGSCLETVNTLRYADRVKQIGAVGRAAGAPAGPRLNTATYPAPPVAGRCCAPGPPALFRSAAPLVGGPDVTDLRCKPAPRRPAAGEKENLPAEALRADDSLLSLDQLDPPTAAAQQHKRRRSPPPPSAGGRNGGGGTGRGGLGLTGGIFGGEVRPLSLGPELSFPDDGGDDFVFPDEPAAPRPPEPAPAPAPAPAAARTGSASGTRPRLRSERGEDSGEQGRGPRGAEVEEERGTAGRGGRRQAAAPLDAPAARGGAVAGDGEADEASGRTRPRQFVESFRLQVEKSMMLIEQVRVRKET